jgi:thymidylate synthase
MHLFYRNVNDAFTGLLQILEYPADCGLAHTPVVWLNNSRAGVVKMIAEPVVVTYSHPRERVLFNRARDCNPFFHLFEALWMLAGRNDVEPLSRYSGQIALVASDDGRTFNGAYGYRWKSRMHCVDGEPSEESLCHVNKIDQLKIIADQLKRKPNSRRCVLQMWNVEDDLLRIDDTKDVCCNTNVYFSLSPQNSALDMTVCNRSNDLVWGMLGANFVHFSVLQEYLAACVGVGVGVYNQFTNNLHVYVERYKPDEWLTDQTTGLHYSSGRNKFLHLVPLVDNLETFNHEVMDFIDNKDWTRHWSEPFLDQVAAPMCCAFELHKCHNYKESLSCVENIKASDWRTACYNWIMLRKKRYESKHVDASAD